MNSFYKKKSLKSLYLAFLALIFNLTHLQKHEYKVKIWLKILEKIHVGSETGSD
jgi:hypothetical protein